MSWNETNHGFAIDVLRKLRASGFIAYFAGGCVRDQLLGMVPTDYDVATNATPQQIVQIFGSKNTLLVGAAFGVACVHKKIGTHQFNVEVATFRSDGVYLDGRRPSEVVFSSPEEDAMRRDFTINGMFFDPIDNRVLDFVGGQQDLKAGVIRAIGDADRRIAEDRLRMVRAVRFAAKFGFRIDAVTEMAIRKSSVHLHQVSCERLADELSKSCALERVAWVWNALLDFGLLETVWPRVAQAWLEDPGLKQQTVRCFESGTFRTLPVCCAAAIWLMTREGCSDQNKALLRKEYAYEVANHLRLSNEQRDEIAFVAGHIDDVINAIELKWSVLQPVVIQPFIGNLLKATRSLCIEQKIQVQGVDFLECEIERRGNDLSPKPLLNGGDLQKLGYKAGPMFRSLLQEVRDRQLDGEVSNQMDAIAFVQARYRQ